MPCCIGAYHPYASLITPGPAGLSHRTAQNKMDFPLLAEIMAKVKFERAAASLAVLSKALYGDVQLWKALRGYQGPKGRTHMMHAAKVGDEDRARFLLAALDRDAQMEECTQWSGDSKAQCGTALMFAARGGTARHRAIAQLLVEKGAPVGAAREGDGATALMMASQSGQLDTARILVGRGADASAACTDDGITALMLASRAGHLDIAKLLVKSGADVDAAQMDDGMTALMWACQGGHLEVAALLAGGGADVNAARTGTGITALMLAIKEQHMEIAQLLVEQCGADVNAARTDTGVTPLMWATFKKHLGLTKLLLERGANVHAEDSNGVTALIVASRQDSRDIARLLMSHDGFPLEAARHNRERAAECAKSTKMEDVILKWSNGVTRKAH